MDDTVLSYELIVHDGGLWIISGPHDISIEDLCESKGFPGATDIYSSDDYDQVYEMQEFLIGDPAYPRSNTISVMMFNQVEQDYYHALDEQCMVEEMV